MEKLCVFLILAIAFNQALGMSVRPKRQSESEEDLEDRYGWDFRPVRPNGGQRPTTNGQRPTQGGTFLPPGTGTSQPGTTQGQGQQPTPTISSGGQAEATRRCLQNCPVTSEYNPVCGTDNVTYSNPGRLICARDCGANVTQARSSPCPAAPSG